MTFLDATILDAPPYAVAVSPSISASNYRTSEEFAAWVNGTMEKLAGRGWVGPDYVVAFPEGVGFPLVLSNEWNSVMRSKTLQEAGLWSLVDEKILVAAKPAFTLQPQWKWSGLIARDLIRLKSPEVERAFSQPFMFSANRWQTSILSGTALLFDSEVREIQETMSLYAPDGHPIARGTRTHDWNQPESGGYLGGMVAGQTFIAGWNQSNSMIDYGSGLLLRSIAAKLAGSTTEPEPSLTPSRALQPLWCGSIPGIALPGGVVLQNAATPTIGNLAVRMSLQDLS